MEERGSGSEPLLVPMRRSRVREHAVTGLEEDGRGAYCKHLKMKLI